MPDPLLSSEFPRNYKKLAGQATSNNEGPFHPCRSASISKKVVPSVNYFYLLIAKFFRTLRIEAIQLQKARNYLFYAVGEVALVAIGILLALKVSNWNEEQNNLIRATRGPHRNEKTCSYYTYGLDL